MADREVPGVPTAVPDGVHRRHRHRVVVQELQTTPDDGVRACEARRGDRGAPGVVGGGDPVPGGAGDRGPVHVEPDGRGRLRGDARRRDLCNRRRRGTGMPRDRERGRGGECEQRGPETTTMPKTEFHHESAHSPRVARTVTLRGGPTRRVFADCRGIHTNIPKFFWERTWRFCAPRPNVRDAGWCASWGQNGGMRRFLGLLLVRARRPGHRGVRRRQRRHAPQEVPRGGERGLPEVAAPHRRRPADALPRQGDRPAGRRRPCTSTTCSRSTAR